MASAAAKTKPQKSLGEFLKEQQEPFILEVYLLEREYSKRWSLNGDSGKSLERSASSGLNIKRKTLLPFSKVLTALHKKFAFHNKSSCSTVTSDSDNRNEDVSVPEVGWLDQNQIVVETKWFSPASTSTVYNSCSDIDEEGTYISSRKDHPSFSSDTCQTSNVCNVGVQSKANRLPTMGKIPPSCRVQQSQNDETVNEDVGGMEHRISSCGVLLPKKITEDSLLSAALWGLLGQSAKKENCTMELRELLLGPSVSQILKSKRVLQKTKKVLFDCVKEITITLPRKDNRQQGFKGPEELGKLICERAKEWGQQAGYETNLSYLLNLDYLNSIIEWSNFEPHVKDISFEITDAILELINNEIISEMIETLPPTI